MCVEIEVNGQYCRSIADLRTAISPVAPIYHDGYSLPLSDDCCLCPIDGEATAAASGYKIKDHDGDPMEQIWIKT